MPTIILKCCVIKRKRERIAAGKGTFLCEKGNQGLVREITSLVLVRKLQTH